MLPGHLVAEYWAEVLLFLEKQHGPTAKQAKEGIADYRRRLDAHRVGDMIYHRDAGDVAATIAGALQAGGFKEPGNTQAAS